MKCQNCGQTVTRKSKFCSKCGEKVVFREASEVSKQEPGKIPLIYGLFLFGFGILVGYAVFEYSSSSEISSVPPPANPVSLASSQNLAVLDIAREFMCPCGQCEDVLDVCECDHKNGALEVKGFIAQKIREGHKKEHITELVQTTFDAVRSKSTTLQNSPSP